MPFNPTRGLEYIEAINKRTRQPTASELKTLKEQHDCESWGEYICMMADEHNVSVGKAWTAFDMLGENEAFDGFVSTLRDEEGSE